MRPEDVPDELIRPAAEVLLRQYGREFNASHLRWQDFAYAASEVLAAALPARDAQIERETRTKVAERVREKAAGYRRHAARRGVMAPELERRAQVVDFIADHIVEGKPIAPFADDERGES